MATSKRQTATRLVREAEAYLLWEGLHCVRIRTQVEAKRASLLNQAKAVMPSWF